MARLPLLLLHGALGSAQQFSNLQPLLEEHFEVYSFDFSGHGMHAANQSPKHFSIEGFVEGLKGFIKEHNLPKVNIFGYSMGGYVALKMASQQPELIDSIITLGTKFDWTPENAAKEVKMLNPEVVMNKVPKFAQMLAKRHGEEYWPHVMIQTAGMMKNLGEKPSLTSNDLNGVETETLIALGSEDPMVSEQESTWACGHLMNASFRVKRGWGHPIEKIDAQQLALLIQEFIG